MLRVISIVISLLVLASCSGWAPVEDRNGSQAGYHQVSRGENLFRIAWRYGLDYRDIARWNRLASPDLILVDQRLRLTPPAGMRASRTASTSKPRLTSRPTVTSPNVTRPSDTTVSTNQSVVSAPAAAQTPTTRRSNSNSNRSSSSRSSKGWLWPAQGRVVKSFRANQPGGNGIQLGLKAGQSVKAASDGQIVYKGSGLVGYGRLIIIKHSDSLLSAYGYLGRIVVEEGQSVKKGQLIAEMDDSSGSRPTLHFEVRKNGRPVNPLRYLPS